MIFHTSSNALHILEHTVAAARGYSLIEIRRSTSGNVSSPCEMAPTKMTTELCKEPFWSRMSCLRMSDILLAPPGASPLMPSFKQRVGKWSVIGFLMMESNLSVELTALIESLCKSCTIRPEKRLKVRGIRVCGFISISTFFWVRMYICSLPALFRGESIRDSRHWCVISGLKSAMFFLFFFRMFW